MTQIVESLFGVSPERYRQQQDVALQQEALAYAQLNPMQRAEAGIYAGARQLAGGIGRMLGGEDPGMRRVTEQDQIIRSINLNDPETYGPAAQRASQMGHTDLAMKILQAGETAFQRRENQNIDEVFRKYRGGAAPAPPVPTPTPTPMAADLPTFDSMQPNVGAGTTGIPGDAIPNLAKSGTRFNTLTGEFEPVPDRDQAAAGLFDTKTKTYSPVFGTLALTAPQILIRLNNKLAALTDNPPEGMTPQMREQMIAATKEEITRLTPNAMAPQAAPSAAQAPVASAIGLEGKLEKLRNDRKIYESLRPTRPGDVSRVTNTIKGIDEEIKRLTETNSTLAKLFAERDRLPPGDPRIQIYDRAIKKESENVEKEPTPPAVGGDRTGIALELYDKPFDKLTPAQRAVVNKKVAEEQAKNAPKIEVKNVMPGDKNLADIPAFRASVQRTIEPQLKTITATEQALTAINDSLATSNFAAYRAAQVQFARAISGAGDLNQKELKAAGADPSLLGGTADYLSTVFSSTPTADTQKKIRSTLQAIRSVSQKQASNEVDQQRKMALRSPGYNAEAVNEALNFPQLQAGAATSAGGDLAAQAAAELARRKGGK